MKNHILSAWRRSRRAGVQPSQIEGAYDKDYWLFIDLPVDSLCPTSINFSGKYGWNAAGI
jgi:hypothetical protein